MAELDFGSGRCEPDVAELDSPEPTLDEVLAAIDACDADAETKALMQKGARFRYSLRGLTLGDLIPSEEELNAMSDEEEAWFAGIEPEMTDEEEAWFAGVPPPSPPPRPSFIQFTRTLPVLLIDRCRRRGPSRAPRSRASSRPQKARAPDRPRPGDDDDDPDDVGRARRGVSS
jgi:hypothetical protein